MSALTVFSIVCLMVVSISAMPGGYGGHGGHGGHGGGYGGGVSDIYRKDHGYDNYDFGYKIADPYTGDKHGRHESKKGYNVYGSYDLYDPYGYHRRVNYVSDHYGTHQTVHGSPNGLYIDSKDLTVVPSHGY